MAAGRRLGLGFVITLLASGCLAGTPEIGAPTAPVGGFSSTTIIPGDYDKTGPFARPLIAGALAILQPQVVELESAIDGARIQIGIVRPDVPPGTRVPVIADASPYYDPMTPDGIRDNPKHDQITFWQFNHYQAFADNFVPQGYAVAFIATRGTAGSGGCVEWFGPRERDDVVQAVSWLGEQEWSNGNVGMIGISYEATTQWMAASTGTTHLKTIVPVAGYPDFYGTVYRNGTGSPAGAARAATFGKYGFHESNPTNGRSPDATLQAATCPAIAAGLAAGALPGMTAQRDPAGYWAERNYYDRIAQTYRGSALVVTGFGQPGDAAQMFPWTRTLEERGVVLKQIIGQWGHTFPDTQIFPAAGTFQKRWDWAEILLHWFDYWLKSDTTRDLGPGVQVQDTLGRWRNEPAWPPVDATPVRLHPAPGGALASTPSAPAGTATVAAGSAPLEFRSEAFEDGLHVAGLSTLHLRVTPRGPGGQLDARLYVETSEGRKQVGIALMDLRVAEGGETYKPVVPGVPLVARMEFIGNDIAVPAGARLVVILGAATQSAQGVALPTATAPVEVALGGDASTLTLPTIERAMGAFFRAP